MDRHGLSTVEALMNRSTSDIAWFWEAVLEDLGIEFYAPYSQILDLSKGVPWPRWCVGGVLNIVHNCLDKWINTPTEDHIAIRWEGEEGGVRQLTYGDLFREVNRVAGALRASGLGKGDAVGLYMPMVPEIAIALLAIVKIGGVVLPLFSGYGPAAIASRLADAAATAIFTADGQYRRGRVIPMKPVVDEALAHVPSVQKVIVYQRMDLRVPMETASERDVWWDDFVAGQPTESPTEHTGADDVLMIIYTSGTTGTPKGVLFSQRCLMSTFHSMIIEGDVKSHDVGMINLPLFHAGGIFAVAMPLLMRGASLLILSGSFEPEKILSLIEQHGITLVMWVPTMLARLLDVENMRQFDLSSLKKLYYGASPISLQVYDKAKSIFKTDFYQFYGQTESGLVSILRPEEHTERGFCTGREMYNCEIRIVDDGGNDVPVGEVGELISKSDNTMMGYLNNQEATAKTIRNGWVYTEDLARVEADGYFTIVGRTKDMIISGGENIYAKEVEDVIISHPAVQEVVVFGIPDRVYGESVCATVVLKRKAAVTDSELIQHCADRMSNYKKPKRIIFTDKLPKNATGKVSKNVLRDPYWSDREQQGCR